MGIKLGVTLEMYGCGELESGISISQKSIIQRFSHIKYIGIKRFPPSRKKKYIYI